MIILKFKDIIASIIQLAILSIKNFILQFRSYNKLVENKEQNYSKILDNNLLEHIEYNFLFNTYGMRLEDQVEHDLVYYCIKAPLTQVQPFLSKHPYFWEIQTITDFIYDASDFIELQMHT